MYMQKENGLYVFNICNPPGCTYMFRAHIS